MEGTHALADRAPPAATAPRLPLAIASFGSFVAALSTSLVAISAPTVATELHVTLSDVSWILTGYLLTVSALLATAGRLADVLGHRRVYLAGFGIYALGAIGCAAAGSLGALVAARVAQGIGSAMLMSTGPAIVTRALPAATRARGLGLQLALTYLGLTLGPIVGGALVGAAGWHAVFLANGAAGALGLALAAWGLPRDPPRAGPRSPLDPAGSALLAIGLSALLLALRKDAGAPVPVLVLAALALAAFALHEARHPAPLLPVGLLATPAFGLGVLGAMVLYVVLFVPSYLVPFHLQLARRLSPSEAGLLMTAQPAVMAIVAPMSGAIADRVGPRAPSIAGMLASAAGLAVLAAGSGATTLGIVAALALLGLGAGLYVAPNNADIMAAAPRERQGTAAAMAATARNVGMAAGVSLAVHTEAALGFAGALLVAAALALVGAALAALRPRASDG